MSLKFWCFFVNFLRFPLRFLKCYNNYVLNVLRYYIIQSRNKRLKRLKDTENVDYNFLRNKGNVFLYFLVIDT